METLGRHLVVEYYGCDEAKLDAEDVVRAGLLAAANAVGATVVGQAFHRYAPQGVTGVVLIAESHLSVHTWPESGYAAVDVFTCGGLDPRSAFAVLGRALGAREARVQEVVRGLAPEVEAGARLMPEDVVLSSRMAHWTLDQAKSGS